MKLIFERSVPGRRCSILPACDVEETPLPESLRRAEAPVLPELSEQDPVSYTHLTLPTKA